MHYFQFEIKEWIANTAHLSVEEEAVYLRLITYYYDSEQPIPLEGNGIDGKEYFLLIRKLRLSAHCETVKIILEEFFTKTEKGWIHDRCDREINRYHSKLDQASRAGRASAQQRLNNRSTTVQPIINHKPLTINQEPPKKNQQSNNYSIEFESFWKAYDKPIGKSNAFKVWKGIKVDEILMNSILEAAALQAKDVERRFRKDPERWLKGKHWEDGTLSDSKLESLKFI